MGFGLYKKSIRRMISTFWGVVYNTPLGVFVGTARSPGLLNRCMLMDDINSLKSVMTTYTQANGIGAVHLYPLGFIEQNGGSTNRLIDDINAGLTE